MLSQTGSVKNVDIKKDTVIVNIPDNSFTVRPWTKIYEYRRLQIEVDSFSQKEAYYKGALEAKEAANKKLRDANNDLSKIPVLVNDEMIKKNAELKVVKSNNKKLTVASIIAGTIAIVEAVLILAK